MLDNGDMERSTLIAKDPLWLQSTVGTFPIQSAVPNIIFECFLLDIWGWRSNSFEELPVQCTNSSLSKGWMGNVKCA